MEEMKVEMRRMKQKVETAVKRGDDFVRYVNIAMVVGNSNAEILNMLQAEYDRDGAEEL